MCKIKNQHKVPSSGSLRYYGARAVNKYYAIQINSSILLMCKVFPTTESRCLVYLMKSKNANYKLWNKNTKLYYYGIIPIVTVFDFINSMLVQKLIPDQLPMLETQISVVVMKHINIIPENPANHSFIGNYSQAFFFNNCEIQFLSTTPKETKNPVFSVTNREFMIFQSAALRKFVVDMHTCKRPRQTIILYQRG